jgi:deoxyribodipyrimidine photo-lyase
VRLPTPPDPRDRDATLAWVGAHLQDLALEDAPVASPAFRGGGEPPDAALALFDARGYAGRRNAVWPAERRGASALSPYVRHGLLPLRRVWDHVGDAPAKDRQKFRDELLWQDYARQVYARVGAANARPLRREPARGAQRWEDPWPREMACMDLTVGELERDGWLVNQTRMWLSSQFTIRAGHDWREGEDRFYRHLLDGSRAANRLGWQWTVGAGTGRPYGFSRWQVEKRAPGLCAGCPLRDRCPVEGWPEAEAGPRVEEHPALRAVDDARAAFGPSTPERTDEPHAVWLTAESLGDDDPALAAHPDLPAVFVFDERFLARVRLSAKRLVFLAETLGELATRREVEVHRGDPAGLVADRRVAVTFAPVPGFKRRAARAHPAELHPWPWLATPHTRSAASYSAWAKGARVA